MRKIIFGLFFLSCSLWCTAIQAYADAVIIKNNKAYLVKDGTEILLEYSPVVFIEQLALYVVGVDKDEEMHNLESGIHFFKQGQEQPFAFVPHAMAGALNETHTISPDKKLLGLSITPTTWGSWYIYEVPQMKLFAEVKYFSLENKTPIWIDTNGKFGVLVEQANLEEDFSASRMCEYDPCLASSVAYYDFKTKKNTVLMKGTALCDYNLSGFENGDALINATCTPKPEEWKHKPVNYVAKKVRKKI